MVYHGGGLFKWLLVNGLRFSVGVVGHRVEGWLWVLWIDPFNRVWRNKIFHNGGFGFYILVYT